MIKDDLKRLAKRLLGKPELKFSSEDYQAEELNDDALGRFIHAHEKFLLDRHHLPPRADLKPYHEPIKRMEPDYNFFNSEVYLRNPEMKPIYEYDNFHSGTPMKYKPYPGSIRAVRKTLRRGNLYWYPRSAGGFYAQEKVVEYLVREGFKAEPVEFADGTKYRGLGVNNIVFTCSTTHAYSLIMSSVLRPNDVVLMTGPNYGLFAIMSELDNYHTEILELREEDDWQVNPELLAKRIDNLNAKLLKEYQEKHGKGSAEDSSDREERAPRVAVFLNLNPHNPTGRVMNSKNREILEGIGRVCKERGMFIIDDLVYRDLTYDLDDLAMPIGTMPEYFNSTISLFGLSKAYSLASIRAGFIVAPGAVAEVLAQKIHDTMDSMPVLQVEAVAGAFNASNRRYREHRRYMNHLIAEYKFRYELLKALVYGISSVKDMVLRKKITGVVKRYARDDAELVLKGCKGKIRIRMEPESGFFAVFDFTALKGRSDLDGNIMKTERDLLGFFFRHGGLTYLMGGNIFWPSSDEFVGRISFGVSRKAIVRNMTLIIKAMGELK